MIKISNLMAARIHKILQYFLLDIERLPWLRLPGPDVVTPHLSDGHFACYKFHIIS